MKISFELPLLFCRHIRGDDLVWDFSLLGQCTEKILDLLGQECSGLEYLTLFILETPKFLLCQTVKTHNDEMPPSRSALFAIKGKNIPQEQKYIIIGKF